MDIPNGGFIQIDLPSEVASSSQIECPNGFTPQTRQYFYRSAFCNINSTIRGENTYTVTIRNIANPSDVGSYGVSILTSVAEKAEIKFAVVDKVKVSANVASTLMFEVSALPESTIVNGITTTIGSATSSISFGTLSIASTTGGSASSSVAAQQLRVATNANYGYTVTVEQDQNLTSSAGAQIEPFKDGSAAILATDWMAPTGDLNLPKSYGHFGITSDDIATTSVGFAENKWKGFSGTSTVEVMRHDGPADALTNGAGLARVAYQVQVSPLQQAGDYTNTLTYICTPTF
jgi:hypothetical protein